MPPKYRIEVNEDSGNIPFETEHQYRGCVAGSHIEFGFNALTRTALKRVLKAYLPDSIFEQLDLSSLEVSEPMDLEMIGGNAVFHLGKIFEASDTLTEIYGSALFLYGNLCNFCAFPGSFEEIWEAHRYCPSQSQMEEMLENPMRPLPYKNMKNQLVFMPKQDAFVYLRSGLFRIDEQLIDTLPCLMITLFLKYKQRPIDSTFEFVDVEGENFKNVVKVFETFGTKYVKTSQNISSKKELLKGDNRTTNKSKKANKSIGGRVAITMKAFEETLAKVTDEQAVDALQRYFRTEPPADEIASYSYYLWAVNCIFNGLNSIFERHPTIFSTQPAVKFVRVFIDGSSKFVMEEEFVKAIGEEYRQGPRHPGYWKTVTEEDMDMLLRGNKIKQFRKNVCFRQLIEEIDLRLIRSPIARTVYGAVPVHGPDGKLCKLAIDVFLEMLDDLILGLRVFDSKVENSRQRVMDFLNGLSDVMDITEKNVYFVREEKYVEINQKVQETFADFKEAERIIDFSKVEANPIDLLKSLCIVDDFTDEALARIGEIAETQMNDEMRRWNDASSASMTVTRLLSIAIPIMLLSKHPLLNTFVHQQNGCYHFLNLPETINVCQKWDAKKCFDRWIPILQCENKGPTIDIMEEKPKEEEPNREELPEDSSTATHSTPQNNPLEVVELSGPSDDKDMIPEQKKEVNNKRILTVDGPVLEGLSSEEIKLIKRAQDEWKSMKAALKELYEQDIAEISQLERLKAELAEQESEMKERTAHRNAQIKQLNDEKKMLEEEKKELELKLKMTPNTRDVFDEIQEGIKTDKIRERVNEMSASVQKMRDAFSEEVEEYVERLKENRRRIEENPQLDPPADLLPDIPLPEVTLEFIRRWL